MRALTPSKAAALSPLRQIQQSPRATTPATSHATVRLNTTSTSLPPATAALSSRWLSDVKRRIGKCIIFGLSAQQNAHAAAILDEMAKDWRELVAGSEGFLTSPRRRGVFRRRVVWGEQDAMGHVNNVLYNRYAETGRIEWVLKYARYIDPQHARAWEELMKPTGEGLILRTITTEFKFPMKFPDHITVYHRLGKEPTEGSDAFLFNVVILSELQQRIAARVTEDCVVYDYRIGKKSTLPPFMVEVLRETWRLQEEAKRTNSERVRDLLDRVRRLEVDSWDRKGAVER